MRGVRGGGGGSEKESKMRREKGGRRELQEFLALEESRGGTLKGENKKEARLGLIFTD